MVKFIFYATRPEIFVQEISHIESLLQFYNTRSLLITDRTQLICLLPQLRKENNVILLFTHSDKDLDDLINIYEQFNAIPTILVLPDDNTQTLQRGMLLHPLYFMAKHAELNQFSLAVNEIYHIYGDHFKPTFPYSCLHPRPGAIS